MPDLTDLVAGLGRELLPDASGGFLGDGEQAGLIVKTRFKSSIRDDPNFRVKGGAESEGRESDRQEWGGFHGEQNTIVAFRFLCRKPTEDLPVYGLR